MLADGIKWHAFGRAEKFSGGQEDWAVRYLANRGIVCPGGHANAANHPDYRAQLQKALRLTGDPEHGVAEADGNLLVTVGLNLITALIIGGAGTSFAHANAIVGVGSSTTAAAVGDTHLGGDGSTTTAWYQQADASNPTQSNGVITCVCTVTGTNADFAWQEWCWATGSGTITAGGTLASVATSVTMLNHKVQSLGTKASGSWVFTATVTLS